MRARGFTFVSFLVLVGILAGIFWCVTYGPAYVERFEVRAIVREAANLCYREKDDEKIRTHIVNQLNNNFTVEVLDHGRTERVLSLDIVPRDDIRIARTETPPEVNIWLSYRRTIAVPFVGQERQMEFTVHAYQDLSPVKW